MSKVRAAPPGKDSARERGPESAPEPAENTPADTPPGPLADQERIQLTPGLVILGLLAVALGLLSALVMSARSLAP